VTKTTVDLANRVLERLKVVAVGETPTAADRLTVENFYAGQYAELKISGLIYWDQPDIPDEAYEALADILAGMLAPDFGMARPDLEASGRARLGIIAEIPSSGLTVTGSYF